jgi:D-glycero-D-manno-heptose 1,7-bisphosphate phosphatase
MSTPLANMERSVDHVTKVKTVFLDRDGVINRKMPDGQYVAHPKQMLLLHGVPGAISELNQAGIRVIVATNQRGISLGLYTDADVEAIHAELQRQLSTVGGYIEAFYVCPHNESECNCRKPLPGLFEQACAQYPDIQAADCLMIGDSLSDIQFGRGLGIRTILIEEDFNRRQSHSSRTASRLADFRFQSLREAVSVILATNRRNTPD